MFNLQGRREDWKIMGGNLKNTVRQKPGAPEQLEEVGRELPTPQTLEGSPLFPGASPGVFLPVGRKAQDSLQQAVRRRIIDCRRHKHLSA